MDNNSKIKPQIRVKLRYSDGKTVFKSFNNKKETEWYIHNEGDHLLEVVYVNDYTSNHS